jgi:hypothetical protein
MFEEIREKIEKTNEQRIKMALTLLNVMKHSNAATIELRASVAASLLDMLQTDMLPEDGGLIKIINEGIDVVCKDAEQHGVENLRSRLQETIVIAKKIIDDKIDRVNEGDSILNNINFNLN